MEDLLNSMANPSFPGYNIIKYTFIIISLGMLGGIIYFLKETSYLKDRYGKDLLEILMLEPSGVGKIAREWRKINKRLETGEINEYKLAVLEADSLVNKVLERMGIEGDDLEEKLENIGPEDISNLRELKRAHENRNNIAHDPDYRVGKEEAERLLRIYKKSLQDLKAF